MHINKIQMQKNLECDNMFSKLKNRCVCFKPCKLLN